MSVKRLSEINVSHSKDKCDKYNLAIVSSKLKTWIHRLDLRSTELNEAINTNNIYISFYPHTAWWVGLVKSTYIAVRQWFQLYFWAFCQQSMKECLKEFNTRIFPVEISGVSLNHCFKSYYALAILFRHVGLRSIIFTQVVPQNHLSFKITATKKNTTSVLQFLFRLIVKFGLHYKIFCLYSTG